MRKMDSLGLKICSYQAVLFEKSIQETNCSSKIFIRRFMNSNLAKRMDSVGFLYDSLSISDAILEIEEQYGASVYGEKKFTVEEMHWIGYIYRYWAYVSEKTSKQIYKIMKPEELRKLYFPYHSLDPLQAIERIMETIEPEEQNGMDDIAKGVIALRKVRNRPLK
ncbi:MAG: antitoxin [Lachnospiraceae bacterium]|nr:antitoxin [Lachnospiraceae bacterium]